MWPKVKFSLSAFTSKVPCLMISLCNLCVLCVSVVTISQQEPHHRGTENTEAHREEAAQT